MPVKSGNKGKKGKNRMLDEEEEDMKDEERGKSFLSVVGALLNLLR